MAKSTQMMMAAGMAAMTHLTMKRHMAPMDMSMSVMTTVWAATGVRT